MKKWSINRGGQVIQGVEFWEFDYILIILHIIYILTGYSDATHDAFRY